MEAALPWLVDCALVWLVVEAGWLLIWRRRVDLVGGLLAGLFLVIGVRLAVGGAAPHWILLCLAGSLPAHLLDLRGRRT